MIILKKLQQVIEMIIQLVVFWTYDYYKNYYKVTAIDLCKQQALYADPKAIQQINFNGNLEKESTIFFVTL